MEASGDSAAAVSRQCRSRFFFSFAAEFLLFCSRSSCWRCARLMKFFSLSAAAANGGGQFKSSARHLSRISIATAFVEQRRHRSTATTWSRAANNENSGVFALSTGWRLAARTSEEAADRWRRGRDRRRPLARDSPPHCRPLELSSERGDDGGGGGDDGGGDDGGGGW